VEERSPATALYGLAMALGGFILLLCATGVVPVGDGFFNAPRWIMAPVALLITAGGASRRRLRPRHRCDRHLRVVARAHEAAAAVERLG